MLARITRYAILAAAVSTSALGAYIAKQPIKIEKEGLTKFHITGKNSWGDVDVNVEDKHLFQGFKVEGKAGDKSVDMEVRSAGLAAGWKITGKIGDLSVEGSCKQDGPFSKSWTVKGKVGERMIEAKADSEWDIDPAAQAVFIMFDCCDDKKPDEKKPEEKK